MWGGKTATSRDGDGEGERQRQNEREMRPKIRRIDDRVSKLVCLDDTCNSVTNRETWIGGERKSCN